jgi:hypothetical protein
MESSPMSPQRQQKVTLTDLLSLLSFTTPLFVGVCAGREFGLAGASVGSAIGLAAGVLNFRLFRWQIRKLLLLPRLLVISLFFCQAFFALLVIPMILMWVIHSMLEQHFVSEAVLLTMTVGL